MKALLTLSLFVTSQCKQSSLTYDFISFTFCVPYDELSGAAEENKSGTCKAYKKLPPPPIERPAIALNLLFLLILKLF